MIKVPFDGGRIETMYNSQTITIKQSASTKARQREREGDAPESERVQKRESLSGVGLPVGLSPRLTRVITR